MTLDVVGETAPIRQHLIVWNRNGVGHFFPFILGDDPQPPPSLHT
jgi:hypothetical protein